MRTIQKLPASGDEREALRVKGQFWTPPWLARVMAGWERKASLKSSSILRLVLELFLPLHAKLVLRANFEALNFTKRFCRCLETWFEA